MKKRLLILVGFLLYFANTQAQEQSEHLLFVGAGAVDYKSTAKQRNVQMQIGGALPYNLNKNTSKNRNTEVGFPFNIFYIPPTFVVDEFEISKGYFTESVKIEWKIGANQDDITSIRIFRRQLGFTGAFEDIASVSATTFEYHDTQVEGGVLFEYQVVAEGVPKSGNGLGKRTINFMEGIGFRNPTATVSGGVTYEGGSPVKDVTVFAEPIGAENRAATSLEISSGTSFEGFRVDDIVNLSTDKFTMQAWLANSSNVRVQDASGTQILHAYSIKGTNDLRLNAYYNNTGLGTFLTISDHYPTGKLDPAGKDVLRPISEITETTFIHVSYVFENNKKLKWYINGREINQEYADASGGKLVYTEKVTRDGNTVTADADKFYKSTGENIKSMFFTSNTRAFIDEFRWWNRTLSNEEIRRDYRRYLGGGENGLAVYLRMDEGKGDLLYDLSKVGFTQNKNDAIIVNPTASSRANFSNQRPTQEQLGVFGVTDQNGSYIISGVGYKGTGESFVVTPSLGVHKFEPASQTVFLGSESSVVNQLNFTDISSFKFNGRIVYNVQNVFNAIATSNPTQLRDFGYNKYQNGTEIINKGEYYYEGGNINSSSGFYEGGILKQYPVIGVAGANVLIDGNIVFDADNQAVLTDEDGNFTVNVPIGNHKVEVTKNGHTFELKGRFPEVSTFEFFEDITETQYFIDNTRVTLVGKVVGGKKEFEKPIGFGVNGVYEEVSNQGKKDEITEIVSSVNNIGTAQITFKGDVNTSILDKIIKTDSLSGEYLVNLIPYKYNILKNGIIIPSNTDISVLSSTETLDLTEITELKTEEFTTAADKKISSEPFNYEKSFRYNSDVKVYLLEQTYDTEFSIAEETFNISAIETPIYKQKLPYTITFEVVQEYINKDLDPITSKEFFTNGNFQITNNLAASGTETLQLAENNAKYIYSFNAGIPNITFSEGFKKSISIQYLISDQNPLEIENINDFKPFGIIIGGKASDGKTFVTTAPESPEIVLRDPPGSNSYASIEKGTKIVAKEIKSRSDNTSLGGGYFISLGPDVSFSAGIIFSVETNIETVLELEGTFSKTTENTSQNETVRTYTFNQTISTSSDPEFVGADGDLFIGNAKNIYYGIFDNMFITKNIPLDKNGAIIQNIPIITKDEDENDVTLYISSAKDYFIAEQPTSTFFTYSQKYIRDELIPELDVLAATGSTSTTNQPITKEYYEAQSRLWKQVLQKNEKAKYIAKNFSLLTQENLIDSLASSFKGAYFNQLRSLVRENFFSNRSFDAGLGEFKNSVTTALFTTNSYETEVETSKEFQEEVGAFLNDLGATLKINHSTSSVVKDFESDEREVTNTISYTLKDNDKNNLLSVNVLNIFDGNGPIFITKGGATSCPYEGEVRSKYFNYNFFQQFRDSIGPGNEILSEATNKVYDVEISVLKNKITNVPEDDNAIFTLLLKNTSQTQTDLEYLLDFDSTSLNGLEINIESNGLNVFLPYNETIEFPVILSKPLGSSTYNYQGIKIFIHSPCALNREKSENSIALDVEFKKSCSNVAISSPENNWIFNNNKAYSSDISGNRTINKLPITFTNFNLDFNGFEKIELQYRNVSAANWTKLSSYYGSQLLKDNAGDSEGVVIASSDSEFTFNWNIVKDDIPDGDYEFRAISYCTDNITNSSEIIVGTINLNVPLVFGTPKPTDGILDPGEDISVRFNEPIFNRVSTSVTVTGLQNQQEIDHSVSVFLDGSSNQIELPNQRLNGGSFTLQFWLESNTTGSGNLVSQENGINIKIDGNHLEFAVGGELISTSGNPQEPIDDSQFNFYSFVYQKAKGGTDAQLLILENAKILKQVVLDNDLDINTNNSIFIGGQNVIGNLHDVRLWSKSFTPAQATVAKDLTLTGRELNLIGYWKLDEGFGKSGLDKAKRKNAIVNLDWAIKPNGTGYEFKNNEYLTLDNVGFIQPSNFEDKTLSFWIKPSETSVGTIFSNGKGDNSEIILTNGFRNKWSINLKSDGNLELMTEDVTYNLTTQSLPVNNWTHVAIVHKVGGSLNSYIDGNEQLSISSAKIGGFTGNEILIGARLFNNGVVPKTIDNHFTGFLDEIRFWNTARSLQQIKRDRYFEIDNNAEGLLLKLDFNEDNNNTTKGPAYNHLEANLVKGTTFSVLSAGASQTFTQDSPPLKPALKFTNIPFSTVINGDEMIITPNLTDQEWSLFEGETINFTVARLSDTHFNTQASPITWSAFVNRQEIEWFTKNQTKEIVAQKNIGETYSFTMDAVNIGGSNQPFTIAGLPTWMAAAVTSGTINPNSSKEITFTVDKELAMGTYEADIFLETSSNFNDRLSFSLRVLSDAPDWSVNPRDYSQSMNVIGRVKINENFSRDQYTKVGAFVNDVQRGEAYLTYDAAYDSYFVFLTVYRDIDEQKNDDNIPIEEVTFKIWDAINGKIIVAAISGESKINFLQNEVLGSKSSPEIFLSTVLAEQNLALKEGWSWVSFFADDDKLTDIKALFSNLDLKEDDIIKNGSGHFTKYGTGFWYGLLDALKVSDMYKIKLAKSNTLRLKGPEISAADFDVNVLGLFTVDDVTQPSWNFLPFPIHRNIALEEALAFYQATDGDVIKDQFNFAIYDATSGWSGTLNYLESGNGYMLKSSLTQTFNYPDSDIAQKTKSKTKSLFKASTNNQDFAQYSSNMNIIAEIIADNVFTNVMVYDANNVLRGKSEIIDLNGKRITFLTVFSNTTDNLKYILANDFEEIDINKNFVFENNGVLGNLQNPIQLSATALALDNINLSDAILYPNPFTKSIIVDFSEANVVISKVEIFNTLGVQLYKKELNSNQKISINTENLSVGVYLIRITDNAGKFVVKKIIRK